MATLPELLQDVLARPAEDAPRVAYASGCDAVNDPRGKYIRAHLRVLITLVRDVDAEEEKERLEKLHGKVWAAPVAGLVERWEFDRGFVGLVRMPASRFLASAGELYAKAPILHLELTNCKEVFGDLCKSPHLARIRSLDLAENGLDDEDMRTLSGCPHLGELRWLSLGYNKIDTFGSGLLAASKMFPKLRFVRLVGNPSNPCEQIADDQGIIVDRWLPTEGELLEKRLGRVPWLHYDWAATVLDVSPDPIKFSRK